MAVKDHVLSFLEDNKGKPVSGEDIARSLDVSRNTVWKAIKSLQAEGYRIDGVTKKGYTLVDSNNNLSSRSIGKYITNIPSCGIRVMSTVDSTNNVAKALAAEGAPEWTAVVSEEQTAGKGRLGRSFSSPPKTGIYMSVILRPRFSAEESLAITTAASVAVAEAVEAVSGRKTRVKWVNDVYIGSRKICGILTEASMSFELGGFEYVVLGIGINVKTPEGGFPGELRETAGAVYETECGDEVRSRLIAEILNRFYEYYVALPQKSFIEEYKKRSLLTGKEIRFSMNGEQGGGTVIGIDDNAGLVVRLDSGAVKTFTAGEVTIGRNFK